MTKNFSFREFRPTLIFLVKFIGLYLAANILYGLYITSFNPQVDPVTHSVSEQTAGVLSALGWDVTAKDSPDKPTTLLSYEERPVLAVYEGCNGINVMIVFVAFIIAFGPIQRAAWFLPAGLVAIHLLNLMRVASLLFVAINYPDMMYFVHKYLFTAILYAAVFVLWACWIKWFTLRKKV